MAFEQGYNEYDNVTADWARKAALSVLSKENRKQLNDCLDYIREAVKNNKLNTNHTVVDSLVEDDLKKRGFKIKFNAVPPSSDPRERDYVTISW